MLRAHDDAELESAPHKRRVADLRLVGEQVEQTADLIEIKSRGGRERARLHAVVGRRLGH